MQATVCLTWMGGLIITFGMAARCCDMPQKGSALRRAPATRQPGITGAAVLTDLLQPVNQYRNCYGYP